MKARKDATAIAELARALEAVVDDEDRSTAIMLSEELFQRSKALERLLDAMPVKMEDAA